MTAIAYSIRVKGHLPLGWSELLEGMEIRHEAGGDTILSGLVKDQAALYGLLVKLQNLGVQLVSVIPTSPPVSIPRDPSRS